MTQQTIGARSVDALRALVMDAVEAAGSGHPGAPMGLAPLGVRLFKRWLQHDPARPDWADRDRLVLSNGHASMLLYGLLHLTGYDVPMSDIRRFRQLGSLTPGHPERGRTPGVEASTGPLGQGVGMAVGLALGEAMLADRFNRPGHDIVDHRTFVIAGDGDLMEGVSSEAASLAGHLRLEKLTLIYDHNRTTIDGDTSLAFSGEDVMARFSAYGWRVVDVPQGMDLDSIDVALGDALERCGRPTLVRLHTRIGDPAPSKGGTAAAHGAPLGAEEVRRTKELMGWDELPFVVPADVLEDLDQRDRGARSSAEWDARLHAYRAAYPELAQEYERILEGRLPEGFADALPTFNDGSSSATRISSEMALNALAQAVPELVGGSADLESSNRTRIQGGGDVAAHAFAGRNIHFGVREHAMAAIANGLAMQHLRPFVATFFTFSDYLRPALRVSAISRLPVIYVFSHDSVALGEDGPTHQPVEHLASLRAMPGVEVIRPCDGTETAGAWRRALRNEGPTVIVLTRQDVPEIVGSTMDGVDAGAYRISGSERPDLVLVATGSEVALAIESAELIRADGYAVSVVSLPCFEAAMRGDLSDVFPQGVPVLSVEAGSSFGWSRWADAHIAVDEFGESGKGPEVYEHFGLTPDAVVAAARSLLAP